MGRIAGTFGLHGGVIPARPSGATRRLLGGVQIRLHRSPLKEVPVARTCRAGGEACRYCQDTQEVLLLPFLSRKGITHQIILSSSRGSFSSLELESAVVIGRVYQGPRSHPESRAEGGVIAATDPLDRTAHLTMGVRDHRPNRRREGEAQKSHNGIRGGFRISRQRWGRVVARVFRGRPVGIHPTWRTG